MLRPCLDCGTLSSGSYCPPHQTAVNRARDARRGSSHDRGYDASWARLSKAARAAEPWCHTEGGCPYPDSGVPPNDLVADHRIPGSLDGGVEVLCRRCNSRRGGARRQAERQARGR